MSVAPAAQARRSQTAATEMIIRDASEANLPAIVDDHNGKVAELFTA